MKYIKRFNESKVITKEELVDKVKFYSSYIENYMNDHNKYVSGALNFNFSYYLLDIKDIFKCSNGLEHNSNDGLIIAICNEFIKWSDKFKSAPSSWDNRAKGYFKFNYEYINYTDEYKLENKRELYGSQPLLYNNYYYIGHKIEELIKGTKWDIPEITEFTNDDNELIINCLINEYEIYHDLISISFNNRYKLLKIDGVDDSIFEYNTDFIDRLQYYFKGLVIVKGWNGIRLYLPFKK